MYREVFHKHSVEHTVRVSCCCTYVCRMVMLRYA